MIVVRRVYLYGIAFAALAMLVGGLAGLLEVLFEAVAEALLPPQASLGASDFANRVSFAGALTGIGLVTWIIHWGLAGRAVARDPAGERRSAIRKLYLYGVLLVGGLVLLFEARGLLFDLFGLGFGALEPTGLLRGDLLPPLARLLATGAFWLYHLRLAARDRAAAPEVGAGATLRRWCLYILAFVALLVLLSGASRLLGRLVELLLPPAGVQVDTGRWLGLVVAGHAASTLAGLLAWWPAWRWSLRRFARDTGPDPERASTLHKVYLYGVLLVVVTWTVWDAGQLLYFAIRALVIPSEAGKSWAVARRELGAILATVAIFGVAWAYHARVLAREAAAAPEQRQQATIRWIYGYLVALVGAATFAVGLGGTLATVLDWLLLGELSSSLHYVQEQVSFYATLIAVGLPVWLLPWARLQREVAAAARRSLARRIYLFVVLGVSVLTLLGTGAYTLYQLLRVLLGEAWTRANTNDLIGPASAAAVALLLLAYHLRVFRDDAVLARQDEETEPAEADRTPAAADGPEPDAAQAAVRPGAGRPTDPMPLGAEAVTLVVVRAASPAEADALRAQVAAALPGTPIRTVRLPAEEAARLLPDDGR